MKNQLFNFCKNNIIYIIFALFVLLNVVCFPDLLNNEDIKINDYSWVINHPEIHSTNNQKVVNTIEMPEV
jgi:hypothetical protein